MQISRSRRQFFAWMGISAGAAIVWSISRPAFKQIVKRLPNPASESSQSQTQTLERASETSEPPVVPNGTRLGTVVVTPSTPLRLAGSHRIDRLIIDGGEVQCLGDGPLFIASIIKA